jgi:beta-glucanase (GH16 family)|tara:strand:- start:4848 stop:6479 length:1632 start_codon:yes stop_codon:yes gene_type:complete
MHKNFIKNISKIGLIKFLFLFQLLLSCSGSSTEEGGSGSVDPVDIMPSNLTLSIEIVGSNSDHPNGDGTGVVKFTANATNGVSYSFRFGTGDEKTSSGSVEYTYDRQGTSTYNIKVLAYSSTNNFISLDKSLTIYVRPDSDQTLLELLAGGSSKTWKINAAQDAHFSNGVADKKYSTYWEAYAFSKASSGFYDDEYIFNVNGTYKHKTNKTIFGKAGHLTNDFGSTSQSANSSGEIENYPLDDYQTTFVAKKDGDLNKLEINGKGFIGFYVGEHNYTIECHDSENIYLRSLDDQDIAWYVWLTSSTVSDTNPKDQFTNLVWSDEFDEPGALDSSKWVHEVGDSWYNNEVQSYTSRLENSKVEDGKLKIIAKKESYNGNNYTSARIISNTKKDFTYGRVDIKAKIPGKKGTWPALWLLGSNFKSITWPACGEIDILEASQSNNFKVQSTVHHPDNYGEGDSHISDDYNDITEVFHIYSLVWTKQAMTFYVDDKPYHIVGNSCALPFNWNQFIILNVAMGGNMGGEIATDFVSDTMEIDYVRIYK